MSELLTYVDVLQKTTKPHLLMGNGFSMAYDPKRFSFTSLLDSAVTDNIIRRDSNIYQLFKSLQTADFESVMRLLDDSVKVAAIYSSDKSFIKKIQSDANDLKGYLVQIITNNHPEKSTILSKTEKEKCLEFLHPYKTQHIYTLNYDLLLYWATMQYEGTGYNDGFGNTEDSVHEGFVVYKSQSHNDNVHYLHGGLHIFDAGDEIIKKTYNNTSINLVEQVRESLSNNIYPIFISEGSNEQKLTKIMHSAYLSRCYRSLQGIGKDLVIFGASLKENDSHILRAILDSKVKNIYFGTSSPENAQHIVDAVNAYNTQSDDKHTKALHLYDYRTVSIWRDKNDD